MRALRVLLLRLLLYTVKTSNNALASILGLRVLTLKQK